MSTCTCCHSTGYQPVTPISGQTMAQWTEHIKKNWESAKPLTEVPLKLHRTEPAGDISNASSAAAIQQSTSTAAAQKPALEMVSMGLIPYYTGYARIDNAIIDALNGKSQEVKDNVYHIIRSDFLPHNVHGLSEEDRAAMIGLGVEKAQYLADNFLEESSRGSFMDAMRSVARIGMQGKRVGECEMEYNVKHGVSIDGNGHVNGDITDEILYTMEKESPKDYETYQKMCKSSGKGNAEAALFALKWLLNGKFHLMNSNKEAYERHKKDQYDDLQEVKLDQTFSGADTSGKKNFLASIAEKLQANQALQTSFFLEQISKMTKTSGAYLVGKQLLLSTRA